MISFRSRARESSREALADVDAISTAADRIRIVMQMADARMSDLAGDGGGGRDVFLVAYDIVLGHVAEIERLCSAAYAGAQRAASREVAA
jgi:hypothetical protein